jgi:tetratricopeptide (TPR) repeat protein
MIRRSAWLVCVGLLGLIGVSCRLAPEGLYQKAVTDAQTLMEQGETNKAVGVLRALFDNRRFDGYRPQLLSSMLQYQLGMDDIAGAQDLFRTAADRDPVLAGSVIGMIEGALSRRERNDELAKWCTILQTYPFEGEGLRTLVDQHFKALTAAGRGDEIPEALAAYLGKLKSGEALSLAQAQFDAALHAGSAGGAGKIMAMVEKQIADSPARQGVMAGMRVDLFLIGNDRAAADAYLRKNLSRIPDDIVLRHFRAVGESHLKANDPDAVEGLAWYVLENVKERPVLRELAGSLWMRAAERRGSIPGLVTRLLKLKDLGFSPSFILDRMDKVYSLLLEQGKKEDFATLYALCEGFYADAREEGLKRRLTAVLLDLGFYLEKYEESLKLVETETKALDPDQTALLTWKIKAHLALQKGQTQEAVRNFRAFMDCVAKGTGTDFDPADNTQVTKEMILGLNFKRIGDILAKAGDSAEAAKAYAEARKNYGKALAEFPDEKTREHQKIQKQMAEIPAK